MMFATQPVYQRQEQQQQQQQPFSNPWHTTATTPTRPSPLSSRRHHSSPSSSSSSMATPSTPNTSYPNNRNLFSSPLANTANTAAGAAPTDPETPLTTFFPSSPLQPDPTSASCFGSPVQKPFSAATSAGPLFSFNLDSNNTRTPTTTSPIASSTNNPSRFAARYAAQIANPLANAAARSTRPYTGTSASPAARTTRRNAFLNRVKRDRADGRFENRGEQLVLLEHVAEQKRWREAMRRSAVSELGPGWDGLVEEEETERDDEGAGAEMDALDQYLLEQERGAFAEVGVESGFDAPAGSGSFSDEDYDDIFMDLAGETEMEGFAHSQEMDMS
ncbi:hypothetical protein ASPACDRAFT_38765 [Aspergillus aculeatus ATCC 16872]|uniref:Uncharacterized protein n=1 Tax=Aspergillus aculeatus (strain ATCC 16872 / CBS 172.66 / WB 5094) TaxID=690307 RepID=A0A1L9X9T1_ASPA1|nr:uncharacterized protein ASPACDRAFT_38765 [Aspergillus aculeatus ATCC 16872]OJK05195.1 hypothetical protein ASPACDRAFT_38765 [Aspergillus aculeatus ATCC 16872]